MREYTNKTECIG